jgi:tetratricopeptide (TPR) repeat protein
LLRLRQKRPGEAEPYVVSALRARPSDAQLYVLLGDIFAARDNRAGMIEAYRRARDIDSVNTEARDKYLAATRDVGGDDAVQAGLEDAVARMPDSADAHFHLAKYLSGHGQLEEAIHSLRRAIAINPAAPNALQYLSETKSFRSPDDPDLARIRTGYGLTGAGTRERGSVAFALAKALDDLKQHDAAFEAYLEANTIQRRGVTYTLDSERRAFEAVAACFSREMIERYSGAGNKSAAPIFIVGMPRSGTTLTETILSRHRDVYAAGELEGMRVASEGVVGADPVFDAKAFVARLTPDALTSIGTAYIDLLGADARQSPRVTDKMPHNFRLIGVIRMAFPNAKIIHMRRDPLDNCLSIFKANFVIESHPYTADLTEIGRYYNLYRGLMRHWRAAVPGGFFELDYEALVSDPEPVTRALFDYCGLEWSPGVLEVEQDRREVRTISFAQVRRSINTASVSTAARYGARLDPLRAALAEWNEAQ